MAAHGPAQLVRFPGSEARHVHRHAHDLLLKDDHAQRLLGGGLGQGMQILHRLSSLPAEHVGADHVALKRARANEGDLHYDVLQAARTHPWQILGLCPAFHLESSNGIGST